MTEAQLLAAILEHCDRLGLAVHHCKDSRYCQGTPGMPDLVIASVYGIMFAELKGEDGDTSADQDMWLYTLHKAAVPYAVWRPQGWESGLIQNHLAWIAGPR